MEPIRIEVRASTGPYPVVVGTGLTAGLDALLASAAVRQPPLVVSCAPVWRHHGRRLSGLRTAGPAVLMGDGERAKTLASVSRLYDACIRQKIDRQGAFLAFGGGVVGDTAGFAAATYLRGIRLVQVPTTLLAQVDSAIGGKVGVNLAAGKNLVGAFHAPSLVVCDTDVLTTLPRREFRAGLYEVIKYGVIASRTLLDRLSSDLDAVFERDAAILTPIVAECCRVKAEVVTADEREAGPRRVLNFGHTIGHALEAVTRYRRFRHGEAVAYGMLAACRLSAMRGVLADSDEAAVGDLVRRLGPLPPVGDLASGDLLAVMQRDKKVVDGRLHLVLARGLGATAVVDDATPAELRTVVRSIGVRR